MPYYDLIKFTHFAVQGGGLAGGAGRCSARGGRDFRDRQDARPRRRGVLSLSPRCLPLSLAVSRCLSAVSRCVSLSCLLG